MATARRTWQKREGVAAEMFGARRQPGSGSSGREDQTRSDSTHPTLFIETKLRDKHAARTLHDATRELAKQEGKTPVVCLADKGRPGFLICVHSDDFEAVVIEWLQANPMAADVAERFRELDAPVAKMEGGECSTS